MPIASAARGHRVGGVHAAARALARADRALDLVDLLAGDQPAGAGPDGLEGVDDRDVAVPDPTREDRPGVDEHRRHVQAGGGHQHAGQRLVAAGERDHPVEALGLHDGLDGVGDDLAAHQREVHALVAHRDAVGDRDGAELQRVAAAGVHALLGRAGQPLQRQVAGRDLVPARGDADLGLREVLVGHADRAQHPAGGGALEAVGDGAAAGLDVGGGGGLGHGRKRSRRLRHLGRRHPGDGSRPRLNPPAGGRAVVARLGRTRLLRHLEGHAAPASSLRQRDTRWESGGPTHSRATGRTSGALARSPGLNPERAPGGLGRPR